MKNILYLRLSELLTEYNISKRKLAEKIGVSAMSISDWSNGKVQPTAENIYMLSQYFHVSADYLLGLEDETGARINQYNNFGSDFGDKHFH